MFPARLLPRLLFLLCAPSLLLGQVLLPEPIQRTNGIHRHPLEIQSQSVVLEIDDAVAQTTIEWVFYNQHPHRIEGTFYLPLPQSAVIQDFEMEINGRKTPAELLGAGKAKKIYTDIVRQMIDPALLEYQRAGLLKARIFPIEARGTKLVSLTYRHTLPQPGTFHEYHLALNKSERPMDFTFRADIKSKRALQTVYAPNFTFRETKHNDHHRTLHFHQPRFQANHDFRLYVAHRKNELGLDLLTHSEGDEHTFMLRLTPSFKNKVNQPAKDILFVIDTSGSMAGEKLNQAKRALAFCLANLGHNDRFSMVTFATETRQFSTTWRDNTDANQAQARTFLRDIRALGGTNLEEALDAVAAMPKAADRPMMVMLLSDGKPTIGTRDTDALVGKVEDNGKRVFVLGIGLKTHTLLLDRIAEKANATSFHVLPEEDLEIKISDLYRHIQYPILSDIGFKCKGIQLEAVHPKTIRDLFAGQPITLLGRFKGFGEASFEITGTSNGKSRRFSVPLQFRKDTNHDFLPRLWAQRRIAFLLEEYRKGDSETEVQQEITRLAKRYGIVTPFTSYLIVEDEAEPRLETTAAEPPRPMRDLRKSEGRSNVVAVQRMRQLQESMQLEQPAAKPRVDVDSADETSAAREPSPSAPGPAAVRYVKGRAFYQQSGVWQDSLWKAKIKKTIPITYNSEAWWKLYQAFPELAPILALGPEVQFTHDGKQYAVSN
ncbi:VWA domain-containing protein [Acanthopleuribacter pedis]